MLELPKEGADRIEAASFIGASGEGKYWAGVLIEQFNMYQPVSLTCDYRTQWQLAN
ncbi:hypothetical protein [Pseudomonas sp. FW300-N1A1]|uniref:hypothetical protein n=1 Tax=Pseudomonas sp. FW300-N1A1 TaxID=2075555 RepID=UPI001304C237|nr:hypothetical protein [Pseudomonas sp. FW300-N1A1]